MKLKHLFLVLLLVVITSLTAQNKVGTQNFNYADIDELALKLPDSLSYNVKGITSYISSKFTKPNDRVRATFVWIASNIQYDIDNLLAVNFNEKNIEETNNVLKNRKGVCSDYAELFNRICNKLDIKTYIIEGYVKARNSVDYLPHAWCASLIDNNWYFFDPTWGSGYIQNNKFVKKINNEYFKVTPEKMITSHIPFDPMWEFLNYPVSNYEFYEGIVNVNPKKPFFNYADSLADYEEKSQIDKIISSSKRIQESGVKNYLIVNKIYNNKQQIEYLKNKQEADLFNSAVSYYNEGVNQLNDFINYRNNQFTPKKTDDEIKNMINLVENSFNSCDSKLNEIKTPSNQNIANISQFKITLSNARKNLNEQQIFIEKYFKTSKALRKTLFYKYL